MEHIDIVLNDWVEHVQRRVALVVVVADEFLVKSTIDNTLYAEMAEVELATFQPVGDCLSTLSSFARVFGSSHLFALDPHEDHDCPFQERDELPVEFEEISGVGEQPHPHDEVLDLAG
jgi:hypothetical protein